MARRRIPLVLALDAVPTPSDPRCRTVRSSDREDLAILLHAAYRGTIDDEGETFADALAEIDKMSRGEYGRFLPKHSFVIEQGEFLASACLVSWFAPHAAPLVVFLMTRPESKRRGMARTVLTASIRSLREAGYARLTLVVTEGNDPARALYDSLGFCAAA